MSWDLHVPLRSLSTATLLAVLNRPKLKQKGDILRPYGPSSWIGGEEAQDVSHRVAVLRACSGQGMGG